jgi:hypothetical protein
MEVAFFFYLASGPEPPGQVDVDDSVGTKYVMSNHLFAAWYTDEIITISRTTVDNDATLDRESILYNDIFDAYRQASEFYRFEERID